MKLLRLADDADDGTFNNMFNENIVLEPNSKVALQNISFTADTSELEITNENSLVTFQIVNSFENIAKLTHRKYDSLNADDLLEDLEETMNASIKAVGGQLGCQVKVGLDTNNKCQIEIKQAKMRDFVSSQILTNVTTNTANTIYKADSTSNVSTYTRFLTTKHAWGSGASQLRCRIQKYVDDNAEASKSGFIVGVSKIDPTTQTLTNSDFVSAVRFTNNTTPYAYFTNGVETITSYQPFKYSSSSIRQNDVATITISEGKLQSELHRENNPNNEKIILDTIDYTSSTRLYPFIIYLGGSDQIQTSLIGMTLDPYLATSNTSAENIQALPSIASQGNMGLTQITTMSDSVQSFLGITSLPFPNPAVQVKNNHFVFKADNIFKHQNFSDAFIVELSNVALDSYDGLSKQKQNILAIIPQSDNNNKRSVLYDAKQIVFIDLNNKERIYLRNIKCRILDNDRSVVNTRGLKTMTLLFD